MRFTGKDNGKTKKTEIRLCKNNKKRGDGRRMVAGDNEISVDMGNGCGII